ncbi:similar to Uncharacterized protein C8orf32 [Ectocarpus siliculosus]|uniref:Protein N-terminal glutamine amidohydrolase n=1 Tax=Ectocarpus siliculosus TaxID=2880 RepID=D7G8M5_ECTSI|nr:similar to Uncharacterized protein C8orf32 [Ectocarpus siliculosus]|eukprot:CBJ34057.1 similar to Uncharacterized protein C8orf32 [Ectocarpus siliculosus]
MGPCGNKGWEGGGPSDGAARAASSAEVAPTPPSARPVLECTRADCRWYTSHYCEENSLRLCNHLLGRAESDGVQLSVVFVSNAARQVPVWFQRLADRRDEPVLWDYHGGTQRWPLN